MSSAMERHYRPMPVAAAAAAPSRRSTCARPNPSYLRRHCFPRTAPSRRSACARPNPTCLCLPAMPLTGGGSPPWRCQRKAEAWLGNRSSSSSPLSLSPTMAAYGGRTRCGWASTVPRLVQTSLRCSRFILFCDFAFVSLICPYVDYESCSIA